MSLINTIPLWIKIAYTVMVFIIIPVYWKNYGPKNFLWLSDVALFLMLIALWFESKLISSMMALGVLPLEVLWTLDFFSGARFGGIARYMFNKKLPLYLRTLSLFHIVLMASIIYMLLKLGYDSRALPLQIALIWILFPITYLLVDRDFENINWVFGLSDKPQQMKHPLLYLLLLLLGITFCVYIPWHMILKFYLT